MTPDELPVDRGAAVVRGAWRSLLAAMLFALAALLHRSLDWSVLWRTDFASCLALGGVFVLTLVLGAVAAWSALRWLLLAMWPAWVGVRVRPHHMLLCFGPFGRFDLDAARIRVAAPPDADEAAPAEFDAPRVTHPALRRDLAETIQIYCRVEPERVRAVFSTL